MIRPTRWTCLVILSSVLYLATGCGGSDGSQGGSQNPLPTLSGISPNSAAAGSSAITITTSGSGFIAASVIQWNGAALSTTYVSGTSLTAQVPVSDLASADTASVAVQSPAPGGGTSSALTFTINAPANPAPTATSLSPSSATAGGPAFTLTVAGTGFIASSQVLWSGQALTTTYVSGTSLTAQVPASDIASAGSASVAVQNPTPGGGTSSALTFAINAPSNPAPTATSLSPSSTTAGAAAFTLTVTGTGFVASSQVLWKGQALTTTYVSGTSLTAQVPASDLVSVGTASVAVQTPAPGGGTSSALTFAINQPGAILNTLNLEGADLAWNPVQQKFYVAVPSTASANAGTITVVDPIAGTILNSMMPSSAPTGLAISDDSQYLYTVVDAGASIQRLVLPALTPDIEWTLGSSLLVEDIRVQPGAPHTAAVSMTNATNPYAGAIAIFDDAVQRPNTAGSETTTGGGELDWRPDGKELYAADGTGTDNGYDSGGGELFTMPVTQSGIGTVTAYGVFRNSGSRLHSDPNTGYAYNDWGEVVNLTNGIPVGNYRWTRPSAIYYNGPMSIVDPKLGLYFTLLLVVDPATSTSAYQIQCFNQTNFQLLRTILIPTQGAALGGFMRWGQSGLAFVTKQGNGNPAPGQLYILDGNFVNPSGALDTSVGTPLNPVPTVTGMTPLTATAGSGAVTLTLTGRDFVGQPTVYWNTDPLPTTLVNSTEVTAEVPASDLASVNQASITVSNTSNVALGSTPFFFAVNTAPPSGNQLAVYGAGGRDLTWDANKALIYVSMPGVQGDAGDAIGIVDPVAGTVTSSGFLGSDPGQLSLSSDAQYLYLGLDGETAINQFTLPDFKVNLAWNLEGSSAPSYTLYYALDIQAAPGAPQTTAVILADFDNSPSSAGLVIYDGSTPRPNILNSPQYPLSSPRWGANDSTLYAVDQQQPQDFFVLGATSAGATLSQVYPRILDYSPTIHYDAGTGLVYTDGGYTDGVQVVQPSNGTVVGSFGVSGISVPDSALNTVFVLGQTAAQAGTPNYTIESFNETTFAPIGSIAIDNVVGKPTALIRWGSNGLAFTTMIGIPSEFIATGPGQLYVVSGSFVNPSDPAAHAVSATPLSPVRRTWNLEPHSTHRSPSVLALP